MKVDEIINQVDRLFSDTSVPRSQTREDLEKISARIECYLDTLADAQDLEPESKLEEG